MRVELSTDDTSLLCTSKNIGLGGLCIATERSFQVGEHLVVRFTLPDQDRSISVNAEVRWVRAGDGQTAGVGLGFVKPSIPSIVAIQECLRSLDEDLTPSWPST